MIIRLIGLPPVGLRSCFEALNRVPRFVFASFIWLFLFFRKHRGISFLSCAKVVNFWIRDQTLACL